MKAKLTCIFDDHLEDLNELIMSLVQEVIQFLQNEDKYIMLVDWLVLSQEHLLGLDVLTRIEQVVNGKMKRYTKEDVDVIRLRIS